MRKFKTASVIAGISMLATASCLTAYADEKNVSEKETETLVEDADEKETEEQVKDADEIETETQVEFTRYGTAGSLVIPEVGISVALQEVDLKYDTSETAQSYVDDKESAAYWRDWNSLIIADHVTQEFGKLYDCKVGTLAYIDDGSEIITLECTYICYGTNEDYYIADEYGVPVGIYNNYVMYTCTDNSYNVLVTFWAPVEEEEAADTDSDSKINFKDILDFIVSKMDTQE